MIFGGPSSSVFWAGSTLEPQEFSEIPKSTTVTCSRLFVTLQMVKYVKTLLNEGRGCQLFKTVTIFEICFIFLEIDYFEVGEKIFPKNAMENYRFIRGF